jgi:hypothetical protein
MCLQRSKAQAFIKSFAVPIIAPRGSEKHVIKALSYEPKVQRILIEVHDTKLTGTGLVQSQHCAPHLFSGIVELQ